MADDPLIHTVAVPGARPAIMAHLAFAHVRAAAYFARGSEAVERRASCPTRQDLNENLANAIGSIFCAVAFLEAGINELNLHAKERNPDVFTPDRYALADALGSEWPSVEPDEVLEKYGRALAVAGKPPFDKGQAPYQPAASVIKLRNALTHYKGEWTDQPAAHATLIEPLKQRFPLNPLAPAEAVFPFRHLGHGCAAWAVASSIAFFTEFTGRLGVHLYLDAASPEVATATGAPFSRSRCMNRGATLGLPTGTVRGVAASPPSGVIPARQLAEPRGGRELR